MEDIDENENEEVAKPTILDKKKFKDVLVLDPETGKVQQAMKPKRKARERNPATIEKQKIALQKARQAKNEYAKQRQADKEQSMLKLRAQQKQDRNQLNKQYKQNADKKVSEPQEEVPNTQEEEVDNNEPIDIRGMIRDVVRSEMLEQIPRLKPAQMPALPRRSRRKSYAPMSTDTEAEIEVKPTKAKRLHKIKAPPPQVPVTNSRVELPVPLLKKPDYNPMADIFGY